MQLATRSTQPMKSTALTVLVVYSILALAFGVVSAQTVSPGVSQGDTFEYIYSVTWSSTDINAQKPNYVTELDKIQTFQFNILSISGTSVNAEVNYHYKDGTSKTETGFVDVQSGSIHLPFGYLIIPGKLNVNDPIYPSGGQATINSTSTRSYSSGDRQTLSHVIEATYDFSYEKKEYSFDRAKGIAINYNFQSSDNTGGHTENFTETITNINSEVWSIIPEFPVTTCPCDSIM